MAKKSPSGGSKPFSNKQPKAVPAPKPVAASTKNSTSLVQWALLLLLPLAIYARTLSFDFTHHDDTTMIVDNGRVLGEPFSFKNIFLTDAWLMNKQIELYRPIQSLTYYIDYQFGGPEPFVYHIHNLLVHLLNGILVFQLLLLLFKDSKIALFGGLAFSLNFLNTHAVSWVPARGDLYLATAGLVFLLSLVHCMRKPSWRWIAINIASFFLAVLSKENGITLAGMGGLWMLYEWRAHKKPLWSSTHLALGAGWMISALIFFSWRSQAIAKSETANLTLQALVSNLRVLPEEFLKWLVPIHFSVMPGYNLLLTVLGAVAMIVFGLAIFRMAAKRDKNQEPRLLILGTAVYLLPLLPSLFYQPQFVAYAYDYLDHRMYFPSVGLVILISLLLRQYAILPKHAQWVTGVMAAFFGLFALLHTIHYKNKDYYYQNAMITNPKSALALTNYGIIKRDEKKNEEALALFEKAMTIAPDFDFLLTEYGNMNVQLGQYDKALAIFNQLLQKANSRVSRDKILNFRGVAYAKQKSFSLAMADFQEAIGIAPMTGSYHQNLGNALEDLGNLPGALDSYTKALQLDPNLEISYFRRGFLYGKSQNPALAMQDLDKAIALNNNNGFYYFYRGLAHRDLKNGSRACEDMRKAASLNIPEANGMIAEVCKGG